MQPRGGLVLAASFSRTLFSGYPPPLLVLTHFLSPLSQGSLCSEERDLIETSPLELCVLRVLSATLSVHMCLSAVGRIFSEDGQIRPCCMRIAAYHQESFTLHFFPF